MATFIPTILEDDPEGFAALCQQICDSAERIHIDFADGSLVPHRTLMPADLSLIDGTVIDAHLMVTHPTQYFPALKDHDIKTAIIHIEAAEPMADIVKAAEEYGLVLAVSLCPETPLETLENLPFEPSFVQLMAVHPGRGGQAFLASAYSRVARLAKMKPGVTIAVDGGVRLANADQLLKFGANLLIVGKGGYQFAQPLEAIKTWNNYLKELETVAV